MKILLDDNIDVRFKKLFPKENYSVHTIDDMRWKEIKNGALLKLLKQEQFDYWIVVDKNLPYEQNISNLPCTIIVLDVFRNTLKHIAPLLPKLLTVLSALPQQGIIVISE